MINQIGYQYCDLLNTATVYSDSLSLSGNDPSSVPYINQNNVLADYVLTDGQVLLGDTGNNPVAGTLTGSSNVTIVNGAGSITIDAAQGINPGSSPTFVDITLTGLTPSTIVGTDVDFNLQSLTTTSSTGCTAIVSGSQLFVDTPQDLRPTTQPSFEGLIIGGAPLSSTSQMQFTTSGGVTTLARTDGSGFSITNVPSAPTTVDNLIDNGLTASFPVHTNASKELISAAISLTADVSGVLPIAKGGTNSSTALVNGFLMNSVAGAVVEGTSATSPSFSGTVTAGQIIDSGLTGSLPVHTNTSKELISAAISLTADVGGVLPIANGGTDSSTALVNGFLMESSGGKIIEGTSSTSPSFSGTVTAGQIIDSGLTASLPVHTNSSKELISAAISLTTDITGVLPIANGGTNSSTALTNGKLIVSSGGAVIEGTSSTNPSFTSATIPTINNSLNIKPSATVSTITLTTTGGNGAVSRNDSDLGTSLTDSGGNFLLLAGGTVTTLNNILDNGGSMTTTGNLTCGGNMICSGDLTVGQSVPGPTQFIVMTDADTISAFEVNGTAVTTQNNVLDDGSGNMTVKAGATLNTDNIKGTSTDLRINPNSFTGYIFLGHDSTTTNVLVGDGTSGNTSFQVIGGGVTTFEVNGTGVSTLNNTLDNGAGNISASGNLSCSKIIQTGINNIQITGLLTLPTSPATLTPVQLFTNLAFNNTTGAYSLTFPTGASIVSFLSSTYGYTLPFNGAFNFRLVNVSSSAISLNAGTGNTFILPNLPFNTATNTQPANTTYTYTFLYGGSNSFFICGG